MRLLHFGFLVAATLAAFCASAHHAATGRYDPNLNGTIEGEITDVFWRNPHVRLLLSRTGEDGQEEEWEIEFGSVNTVERLGISRDLVAVGDSVGVVGRMGRNGLTAMFATTLILPGGREVLLQVPPRSRYGITESAQQEADSTDPSLREDIFRVWLPLTYANPLASNLGSGGYPLTEAGRATQACGTRRRIRRWRLSAGEPHPVAFEDRGGASCGSGPVGGRTRAAKDPALDCIPPGCGHADGRIMANIPIPLPSKTGAMPSSCGWKNGTENARFKKILLPEWRTRDSSFRKRFRCWCYPCAPRPIIRAPTSNSTRSSNCGAAENGTLHRSLGRQHARSRYPGYRMGLR